MPAKKTRPTGPSEFMKNMPRGGQIWRDTVTSDQVTIETNWSQGHVDYIYRNGTRKNMQTRMFMERFERVQG